jgi:release factor glutamine methyltransferase
MSNNVATCLSRGVQYLKSHAVPEAQISAEELLSHLISCPKLSLHTKPQLLVESPIEVEYDRLLEKRAHRYPLQYLVEEVQFRHAKLLVGEGCLIPRPETEVLVDVMIQALKRDQPIHVLDVGTGSGNIAISLALERPEWKFTGTDISEDALQFARANAKQNGVKNRIRFVQTDLWEVLEKHSFDAVVSNPPYLTKQELKRLQPEVTFEPNVALDGGQGGLDYYKRIILKIGEVLKPGGRIFFEVGHQQAEAVSNLLQEASFCEIQITSDFAKIKRVVSARGKC